MQRDYILYARRQLSEPKEKGARENGPDLRRDRPAQRVSDFLNSYATLMLNKKSLHIDY